VGQRDPDGSGQHGQRLWHKLNVIWVGDVHECPDTEPFDAYDSFPLNSANTLCLIAPLKIAIG